MKLVIVQMFFLKLMLIRHGFRKKTGEKYHPFYYTMNFAIKYLILVNFIQSADNRILELTEKGRKVDLDTFDPEKDVRPFLEDNNSQELKKKSLAEIDSAKILRMKSQKKTSGNKIY